MDVRPVAEALILVAALVSAGCAGFALRALLSAPDHCLPTLPHLRASGGGAADYNRYLEIKRRLEQFMPAE